MDDEKRWFILENGQVHGPFNNKDTQSKIATLKQEPLLWWRGLSEWINASQFQAEIKKNAELQNSLHEKIWKLRIAGKEIGNLTHEKMLEQLREVRDLSEVKIWTDGYSDWKEVFHIHKIMDDLGVSRRQHPRVPIKGELTYESPNGEVTAQLSTISEGGLGATDTKHLSIGMKVKGLLQSSHLFQQLHVTAEVVYLTTDGYAGMKFSGIQPETKSSIIEYIKKFNTKA